MPNLCSEKLHLNTHQVFTQALYPERKPHKFNLQLRDSLCLLHTTKFQTTNKITEIKESNASEDSYTNIMQKCTFPSRNTEVLGDKQCILSTSCFDLLQLNDEHPKWQLVNDLTPKICKKTL